MCSNNTIIQFYDVDIRSQPLGVRLKNNETNQLTEFDNLVTEDKFLLYELL